MSHLAASRVVPDWPLIVPAAAPLVTLVAALIAAGIVVVTLIQWHHAVIGTSGGSGRSGP